MTIDRQPSLQRSFDAKRLTYIIEHPLFKAMQNGIDEGNIMLALRKEEVHFYEAGARLLRFTGRKVFTHTRYIDGEGDGERALRDDEWTRETLEQIRRTTNGYRMPDSELAAVHQLFREFAITRSRHRAGETALIDVEARFAPDEDLPSGMIDMVFLLPDRRLLFIEAKCIGNTAVKSQTEAKVVSQVKRYKRYIERIGVRDAMNRSMFVQSSLIGRDLGEANSIAPLVPVLILDPTGRGLSPRSTDTWLKLTLAAAQNPLIDPDKVAVIDGMSDPAAAIRAFVGAFVARFPTCASPLPPIAGPNGCLTAPQPSPAHAPAKTPAPAR